ncbi:magnesium transporter CorA family protein [Niallia sp. 01092]|uniref:magnesium transporter CorA family protein n=1 Tax=unclassified Niallia TaxID=2837522 RepID=UPI003FD4AC3F
MLEMYLTDSTGKLQEVNEISKGCWINLINPTTEEIDHVTNHLNIPVEFMKDALDDEERSRIETEDNNILIIVDYPYITHDEAGFPIYETIPIGMIISNNCFITISLKETPILESFKQNKVKGFYSFKRTRFSLQILYAISTYYLRYLKQINKKTDEIEKELHQSMKNKEIYALLALQKSLVYFSTSLKSNKAVLEKILRLNYLKMYEEDRDLLEDVMIENTQAMEMADTYTIILNGMMDVFASVISNNVNIVMKLLASITVIFAFPTMVSSFYGMNVGLPFQDYPYAFFFILLVAIFLSTTTAIIFWKKKFF